MLTKPDDEVGFVAAVCSPEVCTPSRLCELRGDFVEVIPGPGGVVGKRNVGRLEHLGVRHDHVGVLACAESVLGIVVLAGGELFLVHFRQVDAVLLGQVKEGSAATVFGNVFLIHLDHVRCIIGGGGGGQLVPVSAPFPRGRFDLDVGVFGLERVDHLLGLGVEVLVAPPGKAQCDFLVGAGTC
ncbi:hypothetical protein D9M72_505030 [compost metagenome]